MPNWSAPAVSLTRPGAARTAAPAASFIARSVLVGGASVVAICPRPSPLAGLARTKGLRILSGVPDAAEVTTELGRTKGPLAVLIDDDEALAPTPVDGAVRDAVRERGHGTTAIVVAGQIDDLKSELRGSVVEARKAKAGLLLSPPSALDGDLVGARLPRQLVGRMPTGRGIIALDGEVSVVQVPV